MIFFNIYGEFKKIDGTKIAGHFLEIRGLADCNMEILGPGFLWMQVCIPMFIWTALQHCHVNTLNIVL